MQAYCVKCRTKREMKDAKAVTMKNGRWATCAVSSRSIRPSAFCSASLKGRPRSRSKRAGSGGNISGGVSMRTSKTVGWVETRAPKITTDLGFTLWFQPNLPWFRSGEVFRRLTR